jgi:hypothetical protein
MVPFVTIIIIIQLCFIGALSFKIFTMKESKIVDKIKEDNIILPKKANVPDFNAVDPEYKTLKDVIESAKLEQWKHTLKQDYSSECYDIEIINPSATLKIKSRLRYGYNKETIYISWFHIEKLPRGKYIITYEDNEPIAKYLILNFLWGFVLQHHQNIHDEHIKHYESCMIEITKELKTLNRDKQLIKLLEE